MLSEFNKVLRCYAVERICQLITEYSGVTITPTGVVALSPYSLNKTSNIDSLTFMHSPCGESLSQTMVAHTYAQEEAIDLIFLYTTPKDA